MIPTTNLRALRRAALLLACSLVSTVQAGYLPMVPTLQPYRATSPDGVWTFEVFPSHRFGSGPSEALLSKGKEIVWKKKLPFTFWRACVTDDGYIGGFGYSLGPMGGDPWGQFGGDKGGGDFLVRILDPTGRTIHAETTGRGGLFGGYTGYVPPPNASELLFTPESNVMTLFMTGDLLRSYRLGANPGLISGFNPKFGPLSDKRIIMDTVQVLPNSPLFLFRFEWWEEDKEEIITVGSVFALMNPTGTFIWKFEDQHTLPKDWETHQPDLVISAQSLAPAIDPDDPFAGGDDHPEDPNEDPFAPDPNPAPEPEKKKPVPPKPVASFDIYLESTKERITFTFSSKEEKDWLVAESKRRKWTPPDPEKVPAKVPRFQATKRGVVAFHPRASAPLKELSAAAVGPNDTIHVLDKGSNTIHVFDVDGNHLRSCQPSDDTRLLDGYDAQLEVDGEGTIYAKADKDFPILGKVYKEKYTTPDRFLVFSKDGKQRPKDTTELPHLKQLQTAERRADGLWLDNVRGSARAPDGSFAIRSEIAGNEFGGFVTPFPLPPSHRPHQAIDLYKPDGTPVRTIDFTEGESFDRLAFDGQTIVATKQWYPKHQEVFVLKADGKKFGIFQADQVLDNEDTDLVPFLIKEGSEILVIDLKSARGFRYATPE